MYGIIIAARKSNLFAESIKFSQKNVYTKKGTRAAFLFPYSLI